MPFERELAVAREAARRACDVIMEHYASFVKIADAPADISTIADRESQEMILRCIQQEFPGDALAAEEGTPTLAAAVHQGRRLWIVDPIDGTRGFAMKNGEFSVMIAFVEEGELAVGIVAEPALGRSIFAWRGGGCWAEDGAGQRTRCAVTGVAEPEACSLIQSHSKPGRPTRPAQILKPRNIIETYSAGVKLARVARGEADVYVNTYAEFSDWDIAAGHILVEEAGGKVAGLRGERLRYGLSGAKQRQGLIAANERLLARCVDRFAAEV